MDQSPAVAVLHADADAFFASVETRDDPRLRGRPLAVADRVVCCASYEARAHGVRAGMSSWEATRACPGLEVVRPRPEAYVRASEELFGLFGEVAPVVEAGSMEEAFLDVTRIDAPPVAVARTLRRRATDELGLAVSVGVAGSRLWAKVASRAAKPAGLVRLGPDEVATLRRTLPLEEVWSVGPRTRARLGDLGLETLGDVAAVDPVLLRDVVGTAAARRLRAVVTGTDDEPLRAARPRRTYSAQRVVSRSDDLGAVVAGLATTVAGRARGEERVGDTVVLEVEDAHDARVVRDAARLALPSHDPAVLVPTVRRLLDAAVVPPDVRRVRVTLTGLTSSVRDVQLTLPLGPAA